VVDLSAGPSEYGPSGTGMYSPEKAFTSMIAPLAYEALIPVGLPQATIAKDHYNFSFLCYRRCHIMHAHGVRMTAW
jgi:hypothetical protein